MQPHVEGQPRPNKPIIRLVDKMTGRGDTTLLTFADRKNLRRYDTQLKQDAQIRLKAEDADFRQAMEADRIMRANEPKVPTHIEAGGRTFTFVEYMLHLHEQYEQARTEGRGEAYLQSLMQNRNQRFGTGQPATPEQQQEQIRKTIPDMNHHMAKEAHEAQFDHIAEIVQEKIWKKATSVAVNPVGQLAIDIQDDGTVINRSRYGAAISYTHTDSAERREKVVRMPRSEELSFGIGYFTERTQIIPEAQGSVSDEDLQKGVKAYFVERSYTVEDHGKAVRKTEMVAIPMSDPESMKKFCEHLYASAKSIAPEKVLPEAKQRIKSYRRNEHHAA